MTNHLSRWTSHGVVGMLRVIAVAAVSLGAVLPAAAQIPEPETIFYGKIINRSSGQEALVTQGQLHWVISRPDGTQLALNAAIYPRSGGEFSYQLPVPQEALNFGLAVSSNAIALPVLATNCSHLQIDIDGAPARILVPGSSVFAVAQSFRGATYRLDLEIGTPMPSSGGDGIPDWWKAKYGVTDPNADPDGDGWSNLQEFRMGGDPKADSRIPQLNTRELFVYADGSTGIRLQAVDADSSPSNLIYTVAQVPMAGVLYLSNSRPGTNRTALVVGDTFTQEDVNRGRLVYSHQSAYFLPMAALGVILRDESAAHAASTNFVRLNIFRPNYPESLMQIARLAAETPATAPGIPGLSPDEERMLINYFLSRDHSYVIWDASRAATPQQLLVPSSGLSAEAYAQTNGVYGRDSQHVLMGGIGSDSLAGGMENDILVAGAGNDTLRGNGGADLFILQGVSATIEDFNAAEEDAIDVSRLLNGASSNLADYVQVSGSGSNSLLAFAFAGNRVFTNALLTLKGVSWASSDLTKLVDNGNLLTGGKLLPSVISVLATSNASQNGPLPGSVSFTRTGPVVAPLAVQLEISGSAVNGRDYQSISSQLTFGAGQRVAVLSIAPYVNALTVTQYVQLTVLAGADYSVGTPATAQVGIDPLAPQITIEALQPVASRADQCEGLFLVSRGGILDRSVLVRLNIGGTAPASHYSAVSAYLNLVPQQTTALISIKPSPGVILTNGVEFVQISIKPDATYRVMNPGSARVFLVDQMMTLALWRQRFFPNASQDGLSFAYADAGNTGIRNLFRYAFGLDPQNPVASSGSPKGQIRDGRMVLSFRKPFCVTDLDYAIDVTTDLKSWRPATEADLVPTSPLNSNDVEMVTYQTPWAATNVPVMFMRVRVTPQNP